MFLGFTLLFGLSGAAGAAETAGGIEILLLGGGGLAGAAGLLSPGLLVEYGTVIHKICQAYCMSVYDLHIEPEEYIQAKTR